MTLTVDGNAWDDHASAATFILLRVGLSAIVYDCQAPGKAHAFVADRRRRGLRAMPSARRHAPNNHIVMYGTLDARLNRLNDAP